ncbi:MAG: hypothetical protein WBA16_00215 [Nonlabens sp.]
MNEEKQVSPYAFLSILWRAIAYAIILGAIVLVFAIDATNQAVKEDSLTEYGQAIFLAVSAAISFVVYHRFKPFKSLGFVLGIFYTVLFIREQDAFLENNLFDNAWQVFAIVAVIPLIIYLFRNFRLFTSQLYLVRNSLFIGVLTIGFLIVQLYSRLYGKGKFWESLMGEDNYMRSVKDASEESIELLGYAILFLGTVEMYRYASKSFNDKATERTQL